MALKKTALIMAGGQGTRFWPRSRANYPKQFLSLTEDNKTLIQLTVERILPLVSIEDIYISTNEKYVSIIRQQLPDIPEENLLCEPVGRNTAPCIGLGAAAISKKYEDAIMFVLPSDHLIKYDELFRNVLQDATDIAEDGENLVTIGITPMYPEVGYGYVKFMDSKPFKRGYKVEQFAEKPDLETAKQYLKEGHYLWNSGMFVWKTSSILNAFNNIMPVLHSGLLEIKASLGTDKEDAIIKRLFPDFPSISIDYGIMEKSRNIYTIPGNFGWDDVGSWNAMERTRIPNSDDNIISGNILSINTEHCIIQGDKKLIACVGLEDLVIVDTDDAMLICSKEHTSDIRKVIDALKEKGQTELI